MFQRKKSGAGSSNPVGSRDTDAAPEPTLKLKGRPSARERDGDPANPSVGRQSPRRPVELPVTTRRVERAVPSQPEGKKLIVGRDISLNGQITSCEKLIVEGHVRAELNECREMEITKTGYFKGNAEIENAEVSGHFEGSMIVGDRLFIRATGRVEGDIRYGRLEVECGGKLYGQIMDTDQPNYDSVATIPERREPETPDAEKAKPSLSETVSQG